MPGSACRHTGHTRFSTSTGASSRVAPGSRYTQSRGAGEHSQRMPASARVHRAFGAQRAAATARRDSNPSARSSVSLHRCGSHGRPPLCPSSGNLAPKARRARAHRALCEPSRSRPALLRGLGSEERRRWRSSRARADSASVGSRTRLWVDPQTLGGLCVGEPGELHDRASRRVRGSAARSL